MPDYNSIAIPDNCSNEEQPPPRKKPVIVTYTRDMDSLIKVTYRDGNHRVSSFLPFTQ